MSLALVRASVHTTNQLGAWAVRLRLPLEAERGRFLPWLAVSMIAGAAQFFILKQNPADWPAAVALLLSGLAAALARHHQAVRGGALMAAAFALGFGSAQLGAARVLPPDVLPARAVVLSATVAGVDVLPDGRRLLLHDVRLGVDAEALRRAVRVRLKKGDEALLAAGDRVSVRALLRPPAPPTHPGAWDLQREAFFNGLAGGGTALGPVSVLERRAPSGWTAWWNRLRDGVAFRAMAALPGTDGAVAATLLTGGTLSIPAADRAAFRDSGLAHLLAVAGLHIGIVMGTVMLAARLALAAWPHVALRWPTKAIAAVLALAAGGFYLLLTGAHVPIMRSFAMACLVTLGILVGRRALSLRGLSFGAAALVLIAPQEVVGVSFQMSFAAVLALITGYEALRPVLARLHGRGWRRVAAHVVGLVLTSLLAGTASAPYGAYHFGHVQAWFIAANVVAVPLTAFWVLPLGMLALALMPFGLEHLAFVPMGWGLDGIVAIARGVAAWPAATMAVPPMPGWGLAAFSIGLAWLCLWRSRWRLFGLPVLLAGLLSPLTTPMPDLLVSPDARLIALRDGPAYRLQSRPGAPRFVRDAWQEHLASGTFVPLAAAAAEGCDATTCRRGPVLLLRDKAQRGDCTGVTLVVSAEPARGACRGAALLDRFTVWRDGAHAVYLSGPTPLVVSDRMARGDRPWVPGPPAPRRHVPDLPVAVAESLPETLDD